MLIEGDFVEKGTLLNSGHVPPVPHQFRRLWSLINMKVENEEQSCFLVHVTPIIVLHSFNTHSQFVPICYIRGHGPENVVLCTGFLLFLSFYLTFTVVTSSLEACMEHTLGNVNIIVLILNTYFLL